MGQPFKGLGLAFVFVGSIQVVASEKPLEFRAHPFLTFDTGTSLTADIELADVDGDIDAVVIRDSLPAQLYLNDGRGAFSIVNALPGTGGHARSAAAADVDGDGWLDVVIARRRGADLIVFGR